MSETPKAKTPWTPPDQIRAAYDRIVATLTAEGLWTTGAYTETGRHVCISARGLIGTALTLGVSEEEILEAVRGSTDVHDGAQSVMLAVVLRRTNRLSGVLSVHDPAVPSSTPFGVTFDVEEVKARAENGVQWVGEIGCTWAELFSRKQIVSDHRNTAPPSWGLAPAKLALFRVLYLAGHINFPYPGQGLQGTDPVPHWESVDAFLAEQKAIYQRGPSGNHDTDGGPER